MNKDESQMTAIHFTLNIQISPLKQQLNNNKNIRCCAYEQLLVFKSLWKKIVLLCFS